MGQQDSFYEQAMSTGVAWQDAAQALLGFFENVDEAETYIRKHAESLGFGAKKQGTSTSDLSASSPSVGSTASLATMYDAYGQAYYQPSADQQQLYQQQLYQYSQSSGQYGQQYSQQSGAQYSQYSQQSDQSYSLGQSYAQSGQSYSQSGESGSQYAQPLKQSGPQYAQSDAQQNAYPQQSGQYQQQW